MKKNYMNLKKLRAAILGVALLTTGGLAAQLTVLDYNFTNGVQSFTVPTCVTSISVVAYGAEGVSVGSYNFATGKGGMASGVLSVVPGQVLNIYVGGQNGYNGGGTGQDGGNGGGASDIRVGGTAFANRVIVAGGGGGAGGDSWQCNVGSGDGGGGTIIGTNFVGGAGGAGYEYSSGCGANGGNTGGSGATGYHGGGGGGGGFTTGGIGAVPSGGGGAAGNGSLGLGGNSGYSSGCSSYGAGGGGGGYYGGGGAAGTNCGAGRGGGGSSWTGNLTSPAFQPGVRFGDGKIVLTFPTPSITVSQSNTFICLAQSATITAAGVTSYTWTGPSGVVGFNASAVVNPTVSTVYTVTGVSAVSGCQFVNTVAVAVDNLVMTVSANTAVCVGTPLTLSASGANNYLWSNGWPYASVNITANASNVFTVSGMDANNCSISNTVAVTVNPLPNVTVSATKTLVCRGESITLNASGASTYNWGSLGTGASISISPALNTVYIYTVVGTDANGCSKTGSVVVDVKTCTGVDEVGKDNNLISIYPNPSNGTFNIQSDVKLTLNLVNQLGQVIKTISLDDSHKVVTVTDLADGVYFITSDNKGTVINKKIVVSK